MFLVIYARSAGSLYASGISLFKYVYFDFMLPTLALDQFVNGSPLIYGAYAFLRLSIGLRIFMQPSNPALRFSFSFFLCGPRHFGKAAAFLMIVGGWPSIGCYRWMAARVLSHMGLFSLIAASHA